MKVRLLLLPAAIVVGFIAGACGSPNAPAATLANIDDTGAVFALTGAPESGPTAVDISYPRVMRASPNGIYHWDVVFDIVDGQAAAYPPYLISWNPSTYAGFQETTIPYDSIVSAPTLGYHDSTALNVQAGTVFFVQSFTYQSLCTAQATLARRYLYAKMIIDSIHYYAYDPVTAPAGRVIYYRMRVDPNCGFTGLESGVPAN